MKTLTLTQEHFISQGSHKKCFHYPSQPNCCIKIPYNKAGQVDLNREIFYLTHVLKQRGPQSGILPRYFGAVQTNLGEGHVFELVLDYDGKISQSIETLLVQPLPAEELQKIHDALYILRDRMLEYRVIAMSIYPENILYQKTGAHDFRLVLINDMGSGSSFPMEYWLAPLAKSKIKRYWNRFIENSIPHRLPAEAAHALADLVFPH